MRKDDIVRLRHMLDAAIEAISFAKNKTRNSLDDDRKLVLSLVKSIEIIGEAAANVTPECREEFSHIPWRDIVSMRNRLIHDPTSTSILTSSGRRWRKISRR